MNLTEDYCSFETAKLLKEKGFKQDCDYATSWYATEYYKNSVIGEWFEGEHQIIEDIDDKCTISYLSDENIFIPAPTHQMALKWLREVHKCYIHICPFYPDMKYNEPPKWLTAVDYNGKAYPTLPKRFNSYEQAVEAALLYVLKKLI